MTLIAEVTENFDLAEGTTITAANTAADSSTGTASVADTSAFYTGTASCKYDTTALAASGNLRTDFTSVASGWAGFAFQVTATAPSATYTMFGVYQGSTVISSLRLSTTNTIAIRDGSSSKYTSPVLDPGWYWISVKTVPNTAGGLKLNIYNSSGVILHSSPDITSTIAATGVDSIRWGLISTAAALNRFDAIRFDDTNEVLPLIVSDIVVDAGANQVDINAFDTVTLTGSLSGGTAPFTYAWTQISGTAVTLSGSGVGRTFLAPGIVDGDTLVFQLTVTDANLITGTDTTSVTILLHSEFTKVGGNWVGYIIKNKVSGSWS